MSEAQPQIQSDRLPFDVELMKRADEFSTAAIAAIPELHGLAVIPLWNAQPQETPSGLLRLRNPQPPYVPSLLMLLKRLVAFNADVHQDLVRQFAGYDQYAAELSRQIKARIEELEKLNTPTTDTNENG